MGGGQGGRQEGREGGANLFPRQPCSLHNPSPFATPFLHTHPPNTPVLPPQPTTLLPPLPSFFYTPPPSTLLLPRHPSSTHTPPAGRERGGERGRARRRATLPPSCARRPPAQPAARFLLRHRPLSPASPLLEGCPPERWRPAAAACGRSRRRAAGWCTVWKSALNTEFSLAQGSHKCSERTTIL